MLVSCVLYLDMSIISPISLSRSVEGRFAPLFGEDENLWVVEELLSFSDFDLFVKRMVKVVRRSRK